MEKREVLALGQKHGLGVAAKPDSQDICFVPGGDYAAVVRKLRPEADDAGEIVDLEGRVLGRHRGLIHFTVGQRRGLDIGRQAARSAERRVGEEGVSTCRYRWT